MQVRAMAAALLTAVAFGGVARAGDYTAVEIGHTGEMLRDSALSQDKLYVGSEEALLGRIACLMQDTDRLLARLHALPPSKSASAVAAKPVTEELGHVLSLALADSPELKPMHSELAVLAARTRQAGAPMDPMLSVMLMDVNAPEIPPEFTWKDTVMWKLDFGVSQTYMSYGKRRLKRSIAQLDEDITEWKLAEMERQVISEVTGMYFMMLRTNARLKVMDTNIELMKLLISLGEDKYSLGKTPQALVLNAQVQLTQMERERLDMQRMLDEQRTELAGMLGYPEGFDPAALTLSVAYPLPADVAWQEADLAASALDARPDYQELLAQQRQQQLMLEMAHRDYFPDYTLSADYKVQFKQPDMISAGVMFPLQLNKKERQDPAVQEAYAMLAMTNDEMQAKETGVRRDLSSLHVELDSQRQQIELYRTGLVPQARLALDSNIAAYTANMMDLSDLLMAQQALLNAELALEEGYLDYAEALAKVQVATAGAFDPSPYLTPLLNDTEPAVSLPPGLTPRTQAPETPFVEGLGLPEGASPSTGGESPEPGPEAAPPDDSQGEGGKQSDGGGPDDFYKPFQPRKHE